MTRAIRMTTERFAELQAKAPKLLDVPRLVERGLVSLSPNTGKRSKHGAVKTTIDGEKFDSKHEAGHWLALKLREKAGEIRNLRRQVRFSLFAPGGEHLGTWKADFVFEQFHGTGQAWTRVIADAKSAHTRKLDKWERTKTLMRSCHNVNVRELL